MIKEWAGMFTRQENPNIYLAQYYGVLLLNFYSFAYKFIIQSQYHLCLSYLVIKIIIVKKMDSFKCPMCNKRSNQPINLRCDHHPCFQCASKIITIDHQNTSTLETKYRIICPICQKKTMTYDLRHLIINATEQDQDMYVTAKFINKKPELCFTKKNNYTDTGSARVNGHSKNNSQGSISAGLTHRPIAIECKKHQGHNLQYFCQDCSDKNEIDVFLCGECIKSHKHKIVGIRSAGQKISQMNKRKKQLSFCSRFKFLDETIATLTQKKQKINLQFENLYKQVSDQFKALYHSINEQYDLIKKQIKSNYNKQFEEIRTNLGLAEKLRDSLEELDKISTQGCNQIEAQVHYSLCFFDIQKAIQSNKPKLTEKFEIPKLLKKKSFASDQSQKFYELQYQSSKIKELSRPITPTNSARFLNYSLDPSKNPKLEQKVDKMPDLNMFKQNNFYPISPKNYFSNRSNV